MAKCPECAGVCTYNPNLMMMVCNSCGLSLTRQELDNYWKKIRSENVVEEDDLQRRKTRKKEWLDWYSKSKSEKDQY